jgi:hypothetical protein
VATESDPAWFEMGLLDREDWKGIPEREMGRVPDHFANVRTARSQPASETKGTEAIKYLIALLTRMKSSESFYHL